MCREEYLLAVPGLLSFSSLPPLPPPTALRNELEMTLRNELEMTLRKELEITPRSAHLGAHPFRRSTGRRWRCERTQTCRHARAPYWLLRSAALRCAWAPSMLDRWK